LGFSTLSHTIRPYQANRGMLNAKDLIKTYGVEGRLRCIIKEIHLQAFTVMEGWKTGSDEDEGVLTGLRCCL
jgi:hypothetical protein